MTKTLVLVIILIVIVFLVLAGITWLWVVARDATSADRDIERQVKREAEDALDALDRAKRNFTEGNIE